MQKYRSDDVHSSLGSTFQTQYEKWEQHIHAFVELSDKNQEFMATSVVGEYGALTGLTVAAKDIIDVAGLRTRNGSETCCDDKPVTQDATVVARLRSAGARIVGKTTTTEFAFTDPTNCRNPYDTRRTPGGSSSGSGAAVAAGLVDIALGTQTAGSLIRPASYCGVVGFKPTFGALSTNGVTRLAPSFDTVGIIARSVSVAKCAFACMSQSDGYLEVKNLTDIIVLAALLPTEVELASATIAAFNDASDAFRQLDLNVQSDRLVTDVDRVVANHRIVMNYEAFGAHKDLMSDECVELLKPKFRAGLRAGAAVSQVEFNNSAQTLIEAKTAFWAHLAGVDIVLTLPVPDGAPLIDGTTGFQDWLTPWTVFGGPLITLPWGMDGLGRPRSVMLAAHPGQDMKLLATAASLEQLAPHLPCPETPNN